MHSTPNDTTGTHGLQRPRFFARQLVTPAELNLGLDYVLERLRRHNRLLHGWGVICGLNVCPVPGPKDGTKLAWKVAIKPGHAIDGHGNEVTIDCERIVDLRAGVTSAACGDPPGEARDPFCSDVWTQHEGGSVWVAVCYHACRSRPVRTQPTGCGCDQTTCEYSRWIDGYQVRILDTRPTSHTGTPFTANQIAGTLTGPLPKCPEPPEDPCVVLAKIEVNPDDGTITKIDNCSDRRLVLSAATLWRRCGGVVTITKVDVKQEGNEHAEQERVYKRGTDVTLRIEGDNLSEDVRVHLGQGIEITSRKSDVQDGQCYLQITVSIGDHATPGDRMLTITGSDCSTATSPAFTVSNE